MEGAEHTGPDDDSERDGAAPSRFSSETVTRKGMKQDTEPEPPSMVADFNHLLAEKREAVTCLPNLYNPGGYDIVVGNSVGDAHYRIENWAGGSLNLPCSCGDPMARPSNPLYWKAQDAWYVNLEGKRQLLAK